jgi:hypothetical protein
MERGAAAAAWWGKMRRCDPLGLQTLPRGGIGDPIRDEAGKGLLVEMLELATAALGKMAAGRRGVVGPWFYLPVRQHDVTRRGQSDMAARCRDAVALGGDAEDFFTCAHKAAA